MRIRRRHARVPEVRHLAGGIPARQLRTAPLRSTSI